MTEHDRVEYWTACTEPVTLDQVESVINSPLWDLLPETGRKFYRKAREALLSLEQGVSKMNGVVDTVDNRVIPAN